MVQGNKAGRNRQAKEESDMIRNLVAVNRVAKVVKGGKRFSFSALVVVGDGNGSVGFASANAKELSDAIKKASNQAGKVMYRIPLKEGRTLHHDITYSFGAARVHLRAAPPGTGMIAGGAMRSIFECLGVQDIVCKSLRSSNPHNVIKATFHALRSIAAPRQVASRRGKKVSEIFGREARPKKEEEVTSHA